MATIQDWQYVLPHRKFERIFFIGENAELYEPIRSTLLCDGGQKLSVRGLRGGVKLPDKAVDLIMIDSPDFVNFLFKFNELLKSGGLLFARTKGKVFKKIQNILGSPDWAWVSAYAAFPSFENPWYIVSLDNRCVLAYALKNVFLSRTLLRRFILRGAENLASLGLTKFLMAWLHCVVLVAKKR